MKRRLVLIIAIVLTGTIAFLLVLPGCGGDTGRAKEYMKNGDDITDEIDPESDKMIEDLNQLFADMGEGKITTSTQFKTQADKILDQIKDLSGEAEEAKKEYEKIADLKGVDDYAEYAELRTEIIDKNIEISELIKDFLDEIQDTLAAEEAGQTVDPAAVEEKLTDIRDQISELSKKVEELDDEAKDLQEDKNL